VKALVTSDGTDVLVHFGDQDFLARYKSFEEHLPEWKQQYPKLASADMRYEDQIVLEMQKGTNVPLVGDEADDSTPAAEPAPASTTSRSPSGMTTKNTKATATTKAPTSPKARDMGHPSAATKAKSSPAVAKAAATPKPVATKTKAAASKPAVRTAKPTKPAAGIAGGPQ
jgi:cell division protein FtsQ